MARPKGRTKPARLTVNLDRATYCALNELAQREDVSVSWVIRRAIEALLSQDRATGIGPTVGASKLQINRTHASETALR
ncbi:MAG: ribbon-helix-helix protein, CopG family [Defluviicoccus sp.]|nr:ribbon-helix-helix protein, CopG family [Defluviicoccus sp.]